MQKFTVLAFAATLALAAPVMASTTSDVASDAGAVVKDKTALSKDNLSLAQDKAAKAKADATGDVGGQVVNGASMGADYVVKGEKSTETAVDQKLLRNDANNLGK